MHGAAIKTKIQDDIYILKENMFTVAYNAMMLR
jgi:hypothetical protein